MSNIAYGRVFYGFFVDELPDHIESWGDNSLSEYLQSSRNLSAKEARDLLEDMCVSIGEAGDCHEGPKLYVYLRGTYQSVDQFEVSQKLEPLRVQDDAGELIATFCGAMGIPKKECAWHLCAYYG